jgi:hypothetical protein
MGKPQDPRRGSAVKAQSKSGQFGSMIEGAAYSSKPSGRLSALETREIVGSASERVTVEPSGDTLKNFCRRSS